MVIDELLVRYVEALRYQAVAENMASEQSARMVAMKAASDNAGTVIGELNWSTTRPVRPRSPRNCLKLSAAQPRFNGFKQVWGNDDESRFGTIVQCIGAVVDVQFPRDAMPKVYDALVLTLEGADGSRSSAATG